jgi:response regulator RpfG family c-di-GMP phosphodiesterase
MTATAEAGTNHVHRLLCVDDEEAILRALHRVFRRAGYTVLTATGGEQGLQIIQKTPVSLIVSDQRMRGMSGVEFLRRAKRIAPDTVRILLTAHSDSEVAISAINRGEVFRFLLKPWDDGDLLMVVQEGLAMLNLKLQNRRLLQLTAQQNMRLRSLGQDLEAQVQERTKQLEAQSAQLQQLHAQLERDFVDMVNVCARLIEIHDSHSGSHSQRVGALAKAIAEELALPADEVRDVEIAGILHDIGKIGTPEKLVNKLYEHMTEAERRVIERHPVLGQASIQVVKGLRNAALFIRSHHEHYDGTGYPDRLQGSAIPLGSRIIAVANGYDLASEMSQAPTSLSAVRGAGHRHVLENVATLYDPRVVQAFERVVEKRRQEEADFEEQAITLQEVREGMILSRDLYTRSGLLLVPKDEPLRRSYIEKIRTYNQSDPVVGKVYVYANWIQ